MEINKEQVTENNKLNPVNPKKKSPVVLIILLFILMIIICVLGWIYLEQKKEAEKIQQELEMEKEFLTNDLNDLYAQYDSLKTDNDSMNLKLETEQNKIKKLIAIQASNLEKIRLYKKELKTLRDIMKSYIVQIDSLNTKNLALTAENIEVKNILKQTEIANIELSREKEELTSIVEKASVISAKNIQALPLNKRGKEKNKIKKVNKVKVCFTLRENAITPSGLKDVYIRITRPDKLVLTNSKEDLFEFEDELIVYSAKRQVEYENNDIDMCIYWNNNGGLIPGTYSTSIFLDGYQIGTTTFDLK